MATPDVSVPIRGAIIAAAAIVDELTTYKGSEAVFTGNVPDDTGYPIIVISQDLSLIDEGFVNSQHLLVRRQLSIYGRTDTDFRKVEALGYLLRDLFHRKPRAFKVTGWTVVNLWASGPQAAPVDEADRMCGRMIDLRIELVGSL